MIVPPRIGVVPSDTVDTVPTQRNDHLQTISKHGHRRWQKAQGCRWRTLVKADISGFKRVIRGELGSRTDRRRGTEIAFAVAVMDQMLELGGPECVRLV